MILSPHTYERNSDMKTGVKRYLARMNHLKPLTFEQAKLLLRIASYAKAFCLPVISLSLFVLFAWDNFIARFFPWPHMAALFIFTGWFLRALKVAQDRYSPYASVERRKQSRRAEDLPRIPLSITNSSLLTPAETRDLLWLEKVVQFIKRLQNEHPLLVTKEFARDNSQQLQYALAIMLLVSAAIGWGQWGGFMLSSINPDLGKRWHAAAPELNAWITPPEYTGLSPIIISTPAGARETTSNIAVPEGSTIKALLTESGGTPVLQMNDKSYDFEKDSNGNYIISQTIEKGRTISISRGWKSLGYWYVDVTKDNPPKIAFTAQPTASERKTLQLSYEASDDFGIEHLYVVVAPVVQSSAINLEPVKVSLLTPVLKDMKQTIFEDLTSNRFAGLPVTLQLLAKDGSGNVGVSEKISFKLPERHFYHPLAKALIEERKTLLVQDDKLAREEAISLMAGIARQPSAYRNDPTVMMALRSGAMRLFLNTETGIIPAVSELMWQAAIKIEDGEAGLAQEKLRKTLDNLVTAFDLNIEETEKQQLISRTQQELIQYMDKVADSTVKDANAKDQETFIINQNMISPDDIKNMFQRLRSLSANGEREAAKQRLIELRQFLENIQTKPLMFSYEQKQTLQQFSELKTLSDQQKDLLEDTYRTAQMGKNAEAFKRLATAQQKLERKLTSIIDKIENAPESLMNSMQAMSDVVVLLEESDDRAALQNQALALNMLRRGMIEVLNSKLPSSGAISQK